MECSSSSGNEITKIAIVGGGVSSLLILEALKKRLLNLNVKPNIILFEKSDVLGRGVAYRSKLKSLILNTAINTMSVCEDDHLDFQKWLQEKMHSDKVLTEIPRGVYGEYLEERMSICLKNLKNIGCKIQTIKTTVEKITISGKYTLNFSGKIETCDICIIATGGEVSIPDNIDNSTKDKILNIFDEEKIAKIKKDSRVAILGSGQSAIDACLILESYKLHSHYTLVSRNGILPRVKSNIIHTHTSNVFSNINMKNIQLPLLCKIMSDAIKWKMNKIETTPEIPASFRSMEIDLKRASRTFPSWQRIMNSITPYINEIWFYRTDVEKRNFTDKWYKKLYFLRSAIMPESAMKFLEIYNSGRLGMMWGNYKLVSKDDKFQISMDNSLLSFDYIINTTGIKSYSHLRILEDEIIANNISLNSQMGLKIDFNSMRVENGQGITHNGLYSIGYPTQGSVLIANSVELLRQKAIKIAKCISYDLYKGQL